jgi:hypothetical protein
MPQRYHSRLDLDWRRLCSSKVPRRMECFAIALQVIIKIAEINERTDKVGVKEETSQFSYCTL